MAQALIPLRRAALAALLAATAARPALALGPTAPFEPPRSASAAAAASPASAEAPANGLAGVRLGRKPGAFIDDQWFELGATVRGATLDAVRRDAVELRHPDGRVERLLVSPDVDMHPSAARHGAATSSPKKAPKP